MIKRYSILSIFILSSIILLGGCGTKETEDSMLISTPSATPETTVTVTPSPETTVTPTPVTTATPTPELTPLEKKYQYYDPAYDGKEGCSFSGNAESLEEKLSSGPYYFTWYGYGETDYNDKIEIDEFTRNGTEYGIKCLVPTQYGLTVYYFYLDNPDKIFKEESRLTTSGGNYYELVDNEDNPYANITPEEVLASYTESDYTPLTVDDFYVHALELAKDKISDKIDMISATDVLTGSFEYDNPEDWYFEFDGDCTYSIGFKISYNRFLDSYPYYMECTYVDKNRDYNLTLRNYDLNPQD